MITKSYNLNHDRRDLYKLSSDLREELREAEEINRKAWEWYEDLSEAEYYLVQAEADRRVDEASDRCRDLRDRLQTVEATIRMMEMLEREVRQLESMGVL